MKGIKVGTMETWFSSEDKDAVQVVEKDPTPVKVEDPVEDTLMILGMLKDIKRQEKEKDKVGDFVQIWFIISLFRQN